MSQHSLQAAKPAISSLKTILLDTVKYYMHAPQNREVSHVHSCGARVVAERTHASTLDCMHFTAE